MGVAPSLGGGASPEIPSDISKLAAGLHEEYRVMRRPGKESDTEDICRLNYGRQGKPLLMESLNPNDYFANSQRMDRQLTHEPEGLYVKIYPGQPHYSLIKYPVDIRNNNNEPRYYGERPWRCNDRWEDCVASLSGGRFPPISVFVKCSRSEPGEEPAIPYKSLSRHTVEYYAERGQRGNIRKGQKEKYPWDHPFDPIPPPQCSVAPELPKVD
eukprot:TRINITY_DN1025_c0_g2_i1.p1 TRINITY_DN1025_c0_g2~~TRINITY_DN1025_c0_g2_i1.p1  ORF type:complete len:233 (+),score=23.81 TRINITY_DN1025_c0_g2_i1:61-699(+)